MKSKAGVLCVSFFAFIVLYPALFILIGSLMGAEGFAEFCFVCKHRKHTKACTK